MKEQKSISPEIVVWDFNGTILDDVDAGIHSINELLCERDLAPIPSREAYQEAFGFPIQEYYARIGFDFTKYPYEVLAPIWMEKYLRFVRDSRIFDDIPTTLETISRCGARQIVLSACEQQMLQRQLREFGVFDYFEEVLGLDNIHAASKTSLAIEWRKKNSAERILLIGDTDHDVETARAMGIECVLVARGHQSRARLETLGVPVVANLAEVLEKYF